MMRRRLNLLSLALWGCLGASTVSAGAIPGSEFSYENWQGAAYVGEETNEFMHCGVGALYRSGDYLYFTVNRDATVTVAVHNSLWKLKPGDSFAVSIYIDRRAPFYGTATAISENAAALKIVDFERALRSIQKGYTMTIISDTGWKGIYDLTGTYGALERAKQCALAYYNYPYYGRSPLPQPLASAPHSPAKQEMPGSSGRSIDIAYLYQISAAMIAAADIDDFRFLTESEKRELKLLQDAVYWVSESNGIFAGVSARFVDGDIDIKQFDSENIKSISDGCAGDVAATAQEIHGSEYPAREIRGACVIGDSGYAIYLTEMKIQNLLLEILMMFDRNFERGDQDVNRIVDNTRLRAAKFVVDMQ